jgi:hypothetical protein
MSVLFIAGVGRSGTTTLERVLGETPFICPLGEIVHLWHRGIELDETCGCGQPFHVCPFWDEVGKQAFGGWDAVPAQRVEYLRKTIDRARWVPGIAARGWRPRLAALVDEYTDYYARLYRAATTVSGARVLIDSSKHPSLAFALATRTDVDLRVLHMLRDPRAIAFSWSQTVERPEARGNIEHEMYRWSATQSAGQWLMHNTLLEALRLSSVPVMRLRYEDFVRAPRDCALSVAAWAGAAADDVPVSADGVATLGPSHTVSGNPSRFATGTVPIRLREEWRSGLADADRRRVATLTFPMMLGYGYPIGARRAA